MKKLISLGILAVLLTLIPAMTVVAAGPPDIQIITWTHTPDLPIEFSEDDPGVVTVIVDIVAKGGHGYCFTLDTLVGDLNPDPNEGSGLGEQQSFTHLGGGYGTSVGSGYRHYNLHLKTSWEANYFSVSSQSIIGNLTLDECDGNILATNSNLEFMEITQGAVQPPVISSSIVLYDPPLSFPEGVAGSVRVHYVVEAQGGDTFCFQATNTVFEIGGAVGPLVILDGTGNYDVEAVLTWPADTVPVGEYSIFTSLRLVDNCNPSTYTDLESHSNTTVEITELAPFDITNIGFGSVFGRVVGGTYFPGTEIREQDDGCVEATAGWKYSGGPGQVQLVVRVVNQPVELFETSEGLSFNWTVPFSATSVFGPGLRTNEPMLCWVGGTFSAGEFINRQAEFLQLAPQQTVEQVQALTTITIRPATDP